MKKKILALLVCGIISASFVSCGNIEQSTSASSDSYSNSTINSSINNEITSEEILPPTIVDYGYIVDESSDGYFIKYACEIKNENDIDIKFPTIKITARDDSNAILSSTETVVNYIAAGDTIATASLIKCESMPSSLEMTGIVPDDFEVTNSTLESRNTDFEIFNTSLQEDSVTGEITNTSKNDYDRCTVTAIFRDENDNIITGATGYTEKLSAGETTSFDINCMFEPSEYMYDSITITAVGDIY